MVTLPIKRDLTLAYLVSGIVALIMSVASVAGLLYGSHIYPASQVSSDTGTDALNLVAGLPILLSSMWLARRGSLIGLLCWPGALFYILYVYIFYVLGVPFNALFLPYVVLVTLSAYTTIALVASIDGEAVWRRLSGGVPARTTAVLLILTAILFMAVDVIAIATALANRTPVGSATRVSWIADFTVQLPALLIVGVLLWRRQALGYVAAPGLLLQGSVLNAGFAIVLLLQSIFIGSAINAPFVALVFVIGAISFSLLVFFMRGAASGQTPVSVGAKKI